MARRTDAHFVTAASGSESCNFGHWGILDFLLGTSCKDTASILEDLQDEAHKHRLEERAQKAARGALDGLNEERQESGSESEPERDDAGSAGGESDADNNATAIPDKNSSRGVADEGKEPAEQAPVKRRSARRKAQ
jgi:hypothetical protein